MHIQNNISLKSFNTFGIDVQAKHFVSIDNIEAIKQSSKGKINFYLIALDWRSKHEIEDFLAQHELSIPVLLGTQKTSESFKIGGFPSYYVIDRSGILQSKDMGYTTELGMRIRLGLVRS